MTELLWAGLSETEGLFNGRRAFGISDAPHGDLYVRCDEYREGRLVGPYHLEEGPDGRVDWVKHPEGGQMKPISRHAFVAWLDQTPGLLKET